MKKMVILNVYNFSKECVGVGYQKYKRSKT